jgi:hypothetical protein
MAFGSTANMVAAAVIKAPIPVGVLHQFCLGGGPFSKSVIFYSRRLNNVRVLPGDSMSRRSIHETSPMSFAEDHQGGCARAGRHLASLVGWAAGRRQRNAATLRQHAPATRRCRRQGAAVSDDRPRAPTDGPLGSGLWMNRRDGVGLVRPVRWCGVRSSRREGGHSALDGGRSARAGAATDRPSAELPACPLYGHVRVARGSHLLAVAHQICEMHASHDRTRAPRATAGRRSEFPSWSGRSLLLGPSSAWHRQRARLGRHSSQGGSRRRGARDWHGACSIRRRPSLSG